jgi:hypothetical protein
MAQGEDDETEAISRNADTITDRVAFRVRFPPLEWMMARSVDVVDDDAATLAPETPVFVDATGRRRKILRWAALGGGVLIIGYVVVLIAALFGAPIPSPLLIPVTGVGPVPTEVVPTPSDPATRIAADGHPEQGVGGEAARPSAGHSPATTHKTYATAPEVAGSAVQEPAATLTTTPVPGVDHRNTHAPDTPPGKTDTKDPRP